MSPGRNDPCPCGSGKKFKKCCMNASPHSIVPVLSPAEFNKRIAYEGRVGRERKEWCEDFISWKSDQLNKIIAGQKQIERDTGNRISCSKGCWFCCSQHVGASLQECDAIIYWLHQHEDAREAFLTRYHNWRNRLRGHEDVFQQVTQAGSISLSQPNDARTREVFMQKAESYGRLNILCPFLDQGSCSIYPVRPFVCASQIVVSPPENCKPSIDKVPILLLGAPSPAPHPSYFRGPRDSVMFSPAPLLVYEIINGGFIYLNDLPGLNGLENEVFNDPKIRDLMKDVYVH
jgi:Fe-S-cluster containining protein